MGDHLFNNTLSQSKADIAAYYAKGVVQEPLMLQVARGVYAGEITPEQGIEHLMAEWEEKNPQPSADEQRTWFMQTATWQNDHWVDGPGDPQDEWEHRKIEAEGLLSYRLDVLVERMDQQGNADISLATIRPDTNPRVLVGLGIEPDMVLSKDEVNALIAGRRTDGEQIEGKKYSKERLMKEGKRTRERKWAHPIGSYDFCPTPGKDISVAWAFANEVEQAQIFNAHLEAAREAVAYIATEIGQASLGNAGEDGFEPGHVTWMEFTHHTTRPIMASFENGEFAFKEKGQGISGDPDLHTHFLIPNAVFCDSGRIGSLDTMAIRGFIHEADQFYQARLATKLREAGFAVDRDPRTNAARMSVIPPDMSKMYSKRSNVGEALARKYTADRGEVWEDLSDDQRAARLKTGTQSFDQKVKGEKDDLADFDDWKRQADAAGWKVPASFQFVGPELPPLTRGDKHRVAYEIALPLLAEKLEHRAVITHWELRIAALRGLVEVGLDGLDDAKAVTKLMHDEGVLMYNGQQNIAGNGEKTKLVFGQEQDKRYVSVTTRLHIDQENEFVKLGKAAAADRRDAIPNRLIQQTMRESKLDFSDSHGKSQAAVIKQITTGGKFSVVVGVAGSGKSAILKPIVKARLAQGWDVWGGSLAWRQADELADAGISRHNLKAYSVLIEGIADGTIKLGPKSLVAIDEWGLLGTRQGLELLRAQERYGFSVVSVGDDKQLGSIDAGAIYALSRRVFGEKNLPEILTTKRQEDDREKEIVGLMRKGMAADALDMKRDDGTAEMIHGGREGVIKRVAQLYGERLVATGAAPSISAPTNSDAHQIGEAVRQELRRMGALGADLHTLKATSNGNDYSMRLAKGDDVRLFKSTKANFGDGKRPRSIGRNGSILEVVDVNTNGIRLKTRDGREGSVRWKDMPTKNGRTELAYGYAATIHTSQGSTSTEHIFALPSGSASVTGAAGYSAGTRHRQVSYLLTSEAAERIAVRESRPINDAHEITLDDKWANVAKNLVNENKQDSALAMLEKVQQVRAGSVKAFHDAVRPVDPRMPGQTPAPEVVQKRWLDIGIVQSLQRSMREIKQAYQHHKRFSEQGPTLSR